MDSDRLKRNMWSHKPVSFPEEEKRMNAKHIQLPHLDIKCKLNVMRDLISCTCHSLPSRALQKCANSPC